MNNPLCFDCLNSEKGICSKHLRKIDNEYTSFTATLSDLSEEEQLKEEVKYLNKKLRRREREGVIALFGLFALIIAAQLLLSDFFTTVSAFLIAYSVSKINSLAK